MYGNQVLYKQVNITQITIAKFILTYLVYGRSCYCIKGRKQIQHIKGMHESCKILSFPAPLQPFLANLLTMIVVARKTPQICL